LRDRIQGLSEWSISWCRALNAFPEVETWLELSESASPEIVGKWIREANEDGYIFVGADSGRFSATLPDGVLPEDVVVLERVSGRTPGMDRLKGYLDLIEPALHDRRLTNNAAEWLQTSQRFRMAEGLTKRNPFPNDELLSKISSGIDRAKQTTTSKDLIETLTGIFDSIAGEALTDFQSFRMDGPTYCRLLILLGFMRNARVVDEAQDQFNLVAIFLMPLVGSVEIRATPDDMAKLLVVRALKSGPIELLEGVMGGLHEEGDRMIAAALNMPTLNHWEFYNTLYEASAWLRACVEMSGWIKVIFEEHPDLFAGEAQRPIIKMRHVAEEKLVRISDSLTRDALDILGLKLLRGRGQIMQKLAAEGPDIAATAVLNYTSHGFLYPRAMESYLMGQVDNVRWKAKPA
jgi:hypothetical protein